MPGFDNDVMNAGEGSDVGVFPNTTSSDNSTEFDRDGTPVVSTVFNSADDLGSDANVDIQVNDGSGAGGGNAFLSYTGPTDEWFHGVDKTDSSDYKLQTSTSNSFPAADDVMISDIDGQVTFPMTSAFFVTTQNDQNNVTGDTAVYTIIFETTQFDQNLDWDGTSTFTAPRSGRYYLLACFFLEQVGAACTRVQFRIVTTALNFSHLISSNNFLPFKVITLEGILFI
ncbi:hypothetical protein LCGC14_1035540 [marine sediment metagenome]|uniref:C1q domain-containing protein n=1 Tax=marine sediment metagenome TaxID=412755 RepID=A0A0F9MXY1_9ZZZZ